MTICVHVKHYLNADGFSHFDEWYLKVYEYMSAKEGFESLEYKKYSDEGLIYIKLVFEDLAKLEAWLDEPVHDDLVNELDPYRSENYWEAARTTDTTADWQALEYDRIAPVTPKHTPSFKM